MGFSLNNRKKEFIRRLNKMRCRKLVQQKEDEIHQKPRSKPPKRVSNYVAKSCCCSCTTLDRINRQLAQVSTPLLNSCQLNNVWFVHSHNFSHGINPTSQESSTVPQLLWLLHWNNRATSDVKLTNVGSTVGISDGDTVGSKVLNK